MRNIRHCLIGGILSLVTFVAMADSTCSIVIDLSGGPNNKHACRVAAQMKYNQFVERFTESVKCRYKDYKYKTNKYESFPICLDNYRLTAAFDLQDNPNLTVDEVYKTAMDMYKVLH